MALMEKGTPSTIYNVASGVARSMKSMLEALVARARVTVRIETDPSLLRPSDTPVLLGDATRLRNATGWQPQIPFERTLDDLLTYWRAVTVPHCFGSKQGGIASPCGNFWSVLWSRNGFTGWVRSQTSNWQ